MHLIHPSTLLLIVTALGLIWPASTSAQPAFTVENQAELNATRGVPEPYSSPRHTLRTFLLQMEVLDEQPEDEAAWEKVYETMELGTTAGNSRRDAAWRLLEVYRALGSPDPDLIAPDQVQVEAENITSFELFPDNPLPTARGLYKNAIEEAGRPPSEIVMVRGESGAWRFSGPSLTNANQLVTWARPLGVASGEGALAHVKSETLRRWIPASLQDRFFLGVELWQWIGLALAIFLTLLIDQLARRSLCRLLPRIAVRYLHVPHEETIKATVRPMGLAIGAGVFLTLLMVLGLAGIAHTVLYLAGRIVLVVALTWAAWMASDLIAEVFAARAARTNSKIDDMIVPLLRKTSKLFVVAMGMIYLADTFDVNLLPMLASFGIAGLAVSFAAQDMVKNLFGGLAIFLDRPFKIGDRIVFKGFDGVVEDVGFRVTRLRLLNGRLVSIPNGGITNDAVENVALRPFLLHDLNVGLACDTPPEKVEQAAGILRSILEEPGLREPIHDPANPPRVYLNALNADNLNLRLMYWYSPPDWWAYQAHAHRVHLRILEELDKAGIELAFPTRTLFLADDPRRGLKMKIEEGLAATTDRHK